MPDVVPRAVGLYHVFGHTEVLKKEGIWGAAHARERSYLGPLPAARHRDVVEGHLMPDHIHMC
jgi:hypothetical protein